MAKLGKQQLDGNVEALLMSVLAGGPSYGYQIMRELDERSRGMLKLGEGTVYPVLHRLEDKGWIVSRWEQMESCRPRKYYRLTARGRKALAGQRQQWQVLAHVMNAVVIGDRSPDKSVIPVIRV